ncbi:MAG: hypothetical protein ACREMA_19025, partial [Longimicrobiales bacterium]
TDEERRTLRAAGLPVEDRQAALARERVLWQAVTGTEQLSITYRTSDARGTRFALAARSAGWACTRAAAAR